MTFTTCESKQSLVTPAVRTNEVSVTQTHTQVVEAK